MIYYAKKGQVYYGHSIGILMLDSFVPLIPGDVGNATTYTYPVLYRTLKHVTTKRMVNKESDVLPEILSKGRELVLEGAKAITGDCGFLLLYQDELRKELKVPVFLSSLLQLTFMLQMLNKEEKVGVVTADSTLLDESLLLDIGIDYLDRIKITGLEDTRFFYDACLAESGMLDTEKVEQEIVHASLRMVEKDSSIKAILLECSFLPPYAKAVQAAVNLPVFDFKTMIDYVHSTFVKPDYKGYL